MLKTIINAFKDAEMRKKMFFTLMVVIIFRIGSVIPVPFLNADVLRELMNGATTGKNSGSFFDMMNMFSGGAFAKGTLFALSIQPSINASIIMQLLTVIIPSLEKMSKEGEEGRKRMEGISRYLTVAIGILQALMYYLWLRNSGVELYRDGFEGTLTGFIIVLCLTAGTALIMWLGDQINDKGIGQGTSILLFSGMVARIPLLVQTLYNYLGWAAGWLNPLDQMKIMMTNPVGNRPLWYFYIFVPLFIVMYFTVMWLIVFTNKAERRIPIQYAKRVVGRKLYGGQSTHIPVKFSGSGVMPVIFAQSILSLPSAVQTVMGAKTPSWLQNVNNSLSPFGWIYPSIYYVLILFFAYFYLSIQYNPIEMANNLRQSSGVIPGMRPGKPTSDFIERVLSKITLMGAIFLGIVAVLPFIFGDLTFMYQTIFLGGTSVIIMVSVALETVKQLESQMMMRHYKGFLE